MTVSPRLVAVTATTTAAYGLTAASVVAAPPLDGDPWPATMAVYLNGTGTTRPYDWAT